LSVFLVFYIIIHILIADILIADILIVFKASASHQIA